MRDSVRETRLASQNSALTDVPVLTLPKVNGPHITLSVSEEQEDRYNEEDEDETPLASNEDADADGGEWRVIRRVRSAWARVRDAARDRKHDLGALWFASRDERVPLAAKVSAYLALAAALSPIEVMPILHDIIVVPMKLIPDHVWQEARQRTQESDAEQLPAMWFVTVVGVIIWILIALWVAHNACELWQTVKKSNKV